MGVIRRHIAFSGEVCSGSPQKTRQTIMTRLAAWLAIVALVGNVLAAAFCHPSVKQAPLDYPADLLGAFVICSGAHEGADTGKAPDEPAKPCQICITVAALNLVVALAVIALLFPAATARWSAVSCTAVVADLLRRAGLSRAPPLPA
jgi:hypothetical protein